jgi:DNA-binding MarR family transcriptional regulator
MRRLLDRAARLGAEIDALCGAHGITRDQYEVLLLLERAGPDGLPRRAVSEGLTTRAPDVTRLLDRLSRRALVARGRTASDGRQRVSTLTPEGRALLDRLRPEMDGVLERFAAPLPRRNLRRLSRLLGALP